MLKETELFQPSNEEYVYKRLVCNLAFCHHEVLVRLEIYRGVDKK